jgi:hypothetical protein
LPRIGAAKTAANCTAPAAKDETTAPVQSTRIEQTMPGAREIQAALSVAKDLVYTPAYAASFRIPELNPLIELHAQSNTYL